MKYDPDPIVFIKNALSPAEVSRVLILDEEKRQALAVVADSQFSLAIGKQGQNVRLANRLCDWSIDVKTEEQAAEMDLSEVETRKAARDLFKTEPEAQSAYDEITTVAELPGVDQRVAEILKSAGIEDIERFVEAVDDGSINGIAGLTKTEIDAVNKLINDTVEFVEDDASTSDTAAVPEPEVKEKEPELPAAAEEEEEYFCPECGAKITLDMTHCPVCGCEFEFKEDEE